LEDRMKLSARNILPGVIDKVVVGAVNSEVDLTLKGGEKVVAIITNPSVESLGLKPGVQAFAVIKASEVIIGKGVGAGSFSARNTLIGKVAKIHDGAVNSEVIVLLPGGSEVVASITKSSVSSLELKDGDEVAAIIKASNVILGV